MKSIKIQLFVTALIVTLSLGVKFYFLHHPPVAFFGISFSDLMLKAGAAAAKPTPIPYRDTYMEYPVLTGVFFYLTSLVSRNSNEYFLISGAALAMFGVLTTWLLARMNANIWRFWIFASSLFLFTVYNWDMLAVFFMVLGIYLFLKDKSFWGSLAITLGVWAKLFPIFVLAAVGLDFLKKKRWKDLAVVSAVFLIVSLVLNLPFSLASYDGWSVFFRFNQSRGPNIDSIWAGLWVVSDKIFGPDFSLKSNYISWVNVVSLALLVLGVLVLTIRYWKRGLCHPELVSGSKQFGSKKMLNQVQHDRSRDFILLAFCYLAVFLLTNKVFSPPYSLWILPFFALLPLGKTAFYGFELSNAFVFFAIFQYFYLMNIKGLIMLPFPWFKLTYLGVIARHVFLGILLLRGVRLLPSRERDNL